MEERFKELTEILEQVCGEYENDCRNCPKAAECEEYTRIYLELDR